MGLMAWSAPTAKIDLPGGGDFKVRGLCLGDIQVLWGIFGEELFSVFEGLKEMGADDGAIKDILVEASLMAWIGKVAVDFPDIVATVIAAAVTEKAPLEDMIPQARALPISVQIDALLNIYRLSVEEAGGSKKFVNHLSTLVAVISSMMPGNTLAKLTGTGDSDSQPAS